MFTWLWTTLLLTLFAGGQFLTGCWLACYSRCRNARQATQVLIYALRSGRFDPAEWSLMLLPATLEEVPALPESETASNESEQSTDVLSPEESRADDLVHEEQTMSVT